jgi:predicted O-methyltransferase YrrM
MSHELWSAVDDYLVSTVVRPDAEVEAAVTASTEAGLPEIAVSPTQGKLLHLLATLTGARRILEVGTLGGYSTIWLARALPSDGLLVSLEVDPHHAQVARENIDRAGLDSKVEIVLGPAIDTLRELSAERNEAFDLVFIDADKQNNPEYFDFAVRLGRPGTLIIVDNVVRDGAVVEVDSSDPAVEGTRRLHEQVGADARVGATAIQTVGSTGYDGFLMAVVR